MAVDRLKEAYMKSFKYARMDYNSFYSTDSHVVQWFLSELGKKFPSLKIESPGKDLSGDIVRWSIRGLSGKDNEVRYWMHQQLCQMGWEPFAANGSYEIHFRAEVNN